MALSKEEFKRRLDVALALTGKKRADLKEPLARHGLKKNAAARAGHLSDTDATPSPALAQALGEILGIGRAWFESPNWWELIEGATAPAAGEDDQETPENVVADLEAESGLDEGKDAPSGSQGADG